MMSEPKRVHPISMFIDFISDAVSMIKTSLSLFRAYFCELEFEHSFLCIYHSWCAPLWKAVLTVLAWRRFTYRMEDDEFRIESGVITKKKNIFR